jgi:GWxTD domain-containing protein
MDRYLQTADSLYQAGNYSQSEKEYKKILKKNRTSLAALTGLGNIAEKKRNWEEAKDYFKDILKINATEKNALFNLGICYRETGKFKALLMRKLDWDKSNKYFRQVIGQDSLFKDVLYQYAILFRYREKYEQAIRLTQREINLKPELNQPQVKLFRFYRYFITHTGLDEAVQWLSEQPWDQAHYSSGEKLRREGQLSIAALLFRDMLNDSLGMPDQPLLLSLARIYAWQNLSQKADSCFWKAVSDISNRIESDIIFEDLKYIFTDQELNQYQQLREASDLKNFYKQFWKKRDPLPAAAWNVRLAEHYRRLVYAEQNFEYDGFRGWFMNPDEFGYLKFPATHKLNEEYNDKGLVYIRQGAPNEKAMTSGADVPFNESWLYYKTPFSPRMTFHFMIGKSGNDWRFAPVITNRAILEDRLTWDNIYYQMLNADYMERFKFEEEMAEMSSRAVTVGLSTDRHSWAEKIQPLEIPFSIETFRGDNGKTDVEFSYVLPEATDILQKAGSTVMHDISLEKGFVFYDRRFHELLKDLDHITIPADLDSSYIDQYRLSVPADTYLVGFHVRPENITLLGGYKFRLYVDDYSGNSLQSSNIKLAREIESARDSSKFTRKGLRIVPNPAHRFPRNRPVYLYFEVYNLKSDRQGNTLFNIEYRLKNIAASGRRITNLFGLLGGGKNTSITITSERSGADDVSIEYLALDVSKLKEGDYELSVKITDENSKTSVEKSTKLLLY